MRPLDDRTVERVAELVVDIGGPYERQSYQIVQLLKGAGWADLPDYDGSPRIPWLVDLLVERRERTADIERFLCRVCDPVEYEDGRVSAEVFRESLNQVLAAEQLMVSFVGGRPVLGDVGDDGADPRFSAPDDLEARLRRLVHDDVQVALLVRRVRETVLCQESGAHTMAIIGIGSFVEGLLYALLVERDADVVRHGLVTESGRTVSLRGATLELMINEAHRRDWIQLDAKDFMHTVRRYRNFVHPSAELREQPEFDADSVNLCWAPVRALLNDLERLA